MTTDDGLMDLEMDLEEIKSRLLRAEQKNLKHIDEIQDLRYQVHQMGFQIAELAALLKVRSRPTKVSLVNICALDEERNSAECPDSTVYRYQQGCRGVACVREYRDYYSDYRKKIRVETVNPDSDTLE